MSAPTRMKTSSAHSANTQVTRLMTAETLSATGLKERLQWMLNQLLCQQKLSTIQTTQVWVSSSRLEPLKGSPKSPKSKDTHPFGSTKKRLADVYEADEHSDVDDEESDKDKVFTPSGKAVLRHTRPGKHLAVLQGTKQAEKALKSPLLPLGYQVKEDYEEGHIRLCGATDCILCDWCREACSNTVSHDRNKCTGAKKHREEDTCLRCYKPINTKNFQKPTKKHMHRPDKCWTCPRKV